MKGPSASITLKIECCFFPKYKDIPQKSSQKQAIEDHILESQEVKSFKVSEK